jgi:hypothetical protein
MHWNQSEQVPAVRRVSGKNILVLKTTKKQFYNDEIKAPSTEFLDELLASGIKHHIAFQSFTVHKNIFNRRSGLAFVFYHGISLTVMFLFTASLPKSSSKASFICGYHSFSSLNLHFIDHNRQS